METFDVISSFFFPGSLSLSLSLSRSLATRHRRRRRRRHYWVTPGFDLVLLGFYRVLLRFYQVSIGCTRSDWVLLSFT